MVKSFFGALIGAVIFGVVVCLAGLLLGWLRVDQTSLIVVGLSALGGGVFGWLRPGLFLKPLFFFIEPSVFD